MQPFKIAPAYKDYMWGGTRLKTEYGMADGPSPLAEGWVLSAHPGGPGTVATGPLAGQGLGDVWRARPELFGSRCAGMAEFPILVKFIDAAGTLSIQVHPDDAYARAHEGEAGKTEMWVVLESAPDAFLYFGFEEEISRDAFARHIEDGTLPQALRRLPVQKGDVVFVAAGTLHAIGAGILLVEIQQNSNSTYRVFDFGRLGPDGKPRPLHIQKALDVATLAPVDPTPPGAQPAASLPGGALQTLAACPAFTVRRLALDGEYQETMDGGSFVSLLCCEGEAQVAAEGGPPLPVGKGESVLVPATLPGYTLCGAGTFLLTSI